MHDEQLAKEGTGTTFSEPRAQQAAGGRAVAFDARRGERTWTFVVPEAALAMANRGSLENGDPIATFQRCRQWLHDIAETFVESGHASDQPIQMTPELLTTSDDR